MESARKGDVPAVLGLVHRKLLTPVVSLTFQVLLLVV